jgi:hypothetical protein
MKRSIILGVAVLLLAVPAVHAGGFGYGGHRGHGPPFAWGGGAAYPWGCSGFFGCGGYPWPLWDGVAIYPPALYGPYGQAYFGATPWQDNRIDPYAMAELIRAEAQGDVLGSQAALTRTEVRSREMDNWKKWVETYFEVKRIHRQAEIAAGGPPPTPANQARWARMERPRRLTAAELEVVHGEIAWPMVLQAQAFAPHRDLLTRCFADRARHGILDLDEYMKSIRTTQIMTEMLKDHIREFPPADYMQARRFLESLAYEARLPAGEKPK